MNKGLLIFGISCILVVLLIVVFFSLRTLGDQYCTIEIKNGGQREIILKTFSLSYGGHELTVDTIVLKPNEKFEIGHCIGCSTPDSLDLDINGLGLIDDLSVVRYMYGSELIEYLESKGKVGCMTYVF